MSSVQPETNNCNVHVVLSHDGSHHSVRWENLLLTHDYTNFEGPKQITWKFIRKKKRRNKTKQKNTILKKIIINKKTISIILFSLIRLSI